MIAVWNTCNTAVLTICARLVLPKPGYYNSRTRQTRHIMTPNEAKSIERMGGYYRGVHEKSGRIVWGQLNKLCVFWWLLSHIHQLIFPLSSQANLHVNLSSWTSENASGNMRPHPRLPETDVNESILTYTAWTTDSSQIDVHPESK